MPSQPGKPATKLPPTALSLTTGASTQAICAYYSQSHPSSSCQMVRDPNERKQALRASGCCFVCLRPNHISRNCQSPARCTQCHGKHHTAYVLVPVPLLVLLPHPALPQQGPLFQLQSEPLVVHLLLQIMCQLHLHRALQLSLQCVLVPTLLSCYPIEPSSMLEARCLV